MIVKTTQISEPYSRSFEQKLVDNDIDFEKYEYFDGRVPPMPNNMTEIDHKLTQFRSFLTSSRFFDEEFKAFKRVNARAFNENKVFKTVISFIENKIRDNKCVEKEVFFTNFEFLTDDMFTTAKADLYYDARFEQLD